MARIRTIKPEFWTSEQVVALSIAARLVFIAMWNFADDYGVIPASPKALKMKALPGDDYTSDDITKMVAEMVEQGLVQAFTAADGRPYWHITGWATHQKVDRPNAKYPAPPAPFDEHSTSIRRAFDEQSPPESKGVESKVKESKGKEGRELHAHAEGFENQFSLLPAESETTPYFSTGPAAPLDEYEQTRSTIIAAVKPNDFFALRHLTDQARYDPKTYGPVDDEVNAFIRKNLAGNHRAKFLADPAAFFIQNFPLWLKRAKEFNKPRPLKTAYVAHNARWHPPTLHDARQALKTAHGGFNGEISDSELAHIIAHSTSTADFQARMRRVIEAAIQRIEPPPQRTGTTP